MANPLTCDRCDGDLESDDAVSIIQGVCGWCRRGERRPPQLSATPGPLPPPTPSRSHAAMRSPVPARPKGRTVARSPAPRLGSPPPTASSAPRSATPRRRDLIVGVAFGFVVTAGVTGYLVNRPRGQAPSAPTVSRAPIHLTVLPAEATIMLDGEEIGPADENGRLEFSLPIDRPTIHWLEVVAGGFHEVRRTVSAHSGVRDIHVTLIRKPLDLAVKSDPVNSEVWLNDEFKGYTPLDLAIPAIFEGELTVKRLGYVDAVRSIEPPLPGVKLEYDIRLDVAAPVVRVESDPPGADIIVDGRRRGVTPGAVTLDPADWGETVSIAANLEGFKPATRQLLVPTDPGETPVIRLELTRAAIKVHIVTDPPGGRVIVDGRPVGVSPQVARFTTGQAGRNITIEAIVPGSHYGRAEFIIPREGHSHELTVPMAFEGHRVVFAFSNPDHVTGSSRLLQDELFDRIHRLEARQRFAILAATDQGLESWPEGTSTLPASPEQKVRAYDLARSLRAPDPPDVARLLNASLLFEPNVIWLFVPPETDLAPLREVTELLEDRRVSVNVVTAGLVQSDAWVRNWTAERRGTLTVVGRAARVESAVAGGLDDSDG